MSTKIILASQSPRRRALMESIAPGFTVEVSGTEESLAPGTPPGEAVEQLALRKARAVAARQDGPSGWVVIGADTVVAVDGRTLGKPRDRAECIGMLERLSGREHLVYTGVALVKGAEERVFREEARVRFWPLTPEEIRWYAGTPEPYDKAGGYGIQGLGAVLVREIAGDYFTVMGLPVSRLWRELRAFVPGTLPPG